MTLLTNSNTPKAIGPYSQAVQTGSLVFCSGQTPIDPNTMRLVEGGIETQTMQALKNISMVLKELNLQLSDVVKTNVYLMNMLDFPTMNLVYERMFGSHRPARTTVKVAGLPMNALVEIECVAEIKTLKP